MYKQVIPVYDPAVRDLCCRRYPNHPHGCPNYGKKPGCPPAAPLLPDVLDLSKPVYAIWNVFDFKAHCDKMRQKHPTWSDRQVTNCLYWQGTARKQLREEICVFLDQHLLGLDWVILGCPEASGVNVTETMRSISIELEWPPKTITYQVVLVGSIV